MKKSRILPGKPEKQGHKTILRGKIEKIHLFLSEKQSYNINKQSRDYVRSADRSFAKTLQNRRKANISF